MNKLVDMLMAFLLKYSTIKEEEIIAYRYGLQIGIEVCFNIFICILIAIMFDATTNSAIFISIFMLIRAYAGGLHLSNFSSCSIASTCSLMFILWCIKKIIIPRELAIILIVVLSISIKLIAPVQDENRILDDEEIVKYSKRLKYVILGLLIISITLYFSCSNFLTVICISLAFSMIVLLLGKFKNVLQK